jgi:hypothetical protein
MHLFHELNKLARGKVWCTVCGMHLFHELNKLARSKVWCMVCGMHLFHELNKLARGKVAVELPILAPLHHEHSEWMVYEWMVSGW